MKFIKRIATNEQAAFWCNKARQAIASEEPYTHSSRDLTYPGRMERKEVGGSDEALTPDQIRKARRFQGHGCPD